jgi:hypothetical protein
LKGIVLPICLFIAVSAFGAVAPDPIPGAVARRGFDYQSPYYGNSIHDSYALALKNRFQALYSSYNTQIPSQILLVAPMRGVFPKYAINESNIESAARAFISSLGLMPQNGNLEVVGKHFAMGKTWFINFRRTIGNIPIEESAIGLAISPDGNLNLIWGNFDNSNIPSPNFPVSSEALLADAEQGLSGTITHAESIGRVILPIHFDDHNEYRSAEKFMVVTAEPYAEWQTYVDAQSAEILERTNTVRYDEISGTVSGSIQVGYPLDPWTDHNFFDMDLIFGGNEPVTTDSVGNYTYNTPDSSPIDAYAYFRGPFLVVLNDEGNESELFEIVDPPTTFNIYWDNNNSSGIERDAWFSGSRVHQWIRRLDSDLVVMDYPMNCNINVAGSCNAFWSSWTMDINFYRAGGGCPNIAQIADVIYHEYGHGVTDLQTRPLGPNGAMHEGFSDYLACSMTNQPLVGLQFYVLNPNEPLRNLDNNRRYPDDWSGESHNDGMIIGGALWHTREALSPYSMGYVDSLWHFARYSQAQEFEPYFWSFVELDDNDGDISNGTPNAPTIFYNFGDRHGIGPGTAVNVTANEIQDSEDTTRSFTVISTVESFFPARPDSVILFYDAGNGYQGITMIQSGGNWQGTIPPQHNGTSVNYYVLAVTQAGFHGTAPDGAPNFHYSFWVGPDIIPPMMNLISAPGNTINLYGPYGPFIISANDNNGINSAFVRLHYFINSESEHVEMMNSDSDTTFQLPALDLQRRLYTGDTIHYYFTSLDGAHQPNQGRIPFSGSYYFAMSTSEIFETFENGASRWSHDDTWILRDDGYLSQHSIWYSTPNYPNNANSTFTMNFDYDLAAYSGARVTLMRKNLLRSGDSCLVEVSNNGGTTWIKVGAITGLVAPLYGPFQADISPVLNPSQHHYKIRFRFVSDAESTWVGAMIDNIGWSVDPFVDGIDEGVSLPLETSLLQNYPNPFNPETRIQFTLAGSSNVKLEVFDILGRLVNTLYNDKLNSGSYCIVWNGTDNSSNQVSSGVYFYRLSTDQGIKQQKMTLLR